jgi:hypothetical protein
MFLDGRREDKSLWTEWYQALPEFSLLLISSRISFRSVIVVLKYLNCATFSKHVSYRYVMTFPCILVTRYIYGIYIITQ